MKGEIVKNGSSYATDEIEELIDRELLKQRDNDRKRIVGEYYFSELPFCIRMIYWRYMNPKPISASTLRVFERGSMIETWLLNILRKSEEIEDFKEQKTLIFPVDDFVVKGRFDGFFLIRGRNMIMEIKSMDGNVDKLDMPKLHHIEQLNPYLLFKPNLEGEVRYISAGNFRTKAFHWTFDKGMFDRSIERAKKLNSFLLSEKVPPAESYEDQTKIWMCNNKYCEFFEECMEIERNKKELKK